MNKTYTPAKKKEQAQLYNAAFIWFNRTTLVAVFDENYDVLVLKVEAAIAAFSRKWAGAAVEVDWQHI